MKKINIMTSADQLEIQLDHPDYGTKFMSLSVEGLDYWASDEELEEWTREMLAEVNKYVNPTGFWHTVKITQIFVLGNDICRAVLQEE